MVGAWTRRRPARTAGRTTPRPPRRPAFPRRELPAQHLDHLLDHPRVEPAPTAGGSPPSRPPPRRGTTPGPTATRAPRRAPVRLPDRPRSCPAGARHRGPTTVGQPHSLALRGCPSRPPRTSYPTSAAVSVGSVSTPAARRTRRRAVPIRRPPSPGPARARRAGGARCRRPGTTRPAGRPPCRGSAAPVATAAAATYGALPRRRVPLARVLGHQLLDQDRRARPCPSPDIEATMYPSGSTTTRVGQARAV